MNSEWEMNIPDYEVIRIKGELLNKLIKYCQFDSVATESGGVLIGKHLNSGGVILIDDFTPPQASDKQGRCSYYRSEEHSIIVRQIWQKSDGHSTYVGLWHTHPEPTPNYSSVDKKDWLNALNSSSYEGSRLFFVIVGQTHIRCWTGTKGQFRNKIELTGEFKIEK